MFVSLNVVGRWYFLIAFIFQICLLLIAAFPIPSPKEITSVISREFWHVHVSALERACSTAFI